MSKAKLRLKRGGVAALVAIAVIVPLLSWGTAASASSSGYWLLAGDGGVFAFGAGFAGSAASDPQRCPAVTTDRSEPNGTCFSIAANPIGHGYWVLNGDTGAIYPFGDSLFYGDPAEAFAGVPREFVPIGRAIVATPTGHGYWVLEAGLSGLGSVRAFGDAVFYGDTVQQATAHAGVPVALVATHDGRGYWIVDSDGGVFGFGDAVFLGSMGGRTLNQPVVGAAATPDGRGYYLVSADGGVFTFGDATFTGSMGGQRLNQPVVGVAVDPASRGYWLVAADGGVFAFGGAPFRGSLGATPINRPIFAIASGSNAT